MRVNPIVVMTDPKVTTDERSATLEITSSNDYRAALHNEAPNMAPLCDFCPIIIKAQQTEGYSQNDTGKLSPKYLFNCNLEKGCTPTHKRYQRNKKSVVQQSILKLQQSWLNQNRSRIQPLISAASQERLLMNVFFFVPHLMHLPSEYNFFPFSNFFNWAEKLPLIHHLPIIFFQIEKKTFSMTIPIASTLPCLANDFNQTLAAWVHWLKIINH